MRRVDRSLIVAGIVGLIVTCFCSGLWFGALHLSETTKQNRTFQSGGKRYEQLPNEKGFAAYPDLQSAACYNAKNHDSADLCAQYRAAIAAEQSARSSNAANVLSAIASLLSGCGLVALLITIRQGREALQRADNANMIATTTMHNQLRPWIVIEECKVDEMYLSGLLDNELVPLVTRAQIRIKNVGPSPARNVHVIMSVVRNSTVQSLALKYDEFCLECLNLEPVGGVTVSSSEVYESSHGWAGLQFPIAEVRNANTNVHIAVIVSVCYSSEHIPERAQSTRWSLVAREIVKNTPQGLTINDLPKRPRNDEEAQFKGALSRIPGEKMT